MENINNIAMINYSTISNRMEKTGDSFLDDLDVSNGILKFLLSNKKMAASNISEKKEENVEVKKRRSKSAEKNESSPKNKPKDKNKKKKEKKTKEKKTSRSQQPKKLNAYQIFRSFEFMRMTIKKEEEMKLNQENKIKEKKKSKENNKEDEIPTNEKEAIKPVDEKKKPSGNQLGEKNIFISKKWGQLNSGEKSRYGEIAEFLRRNYYPEEKPTKKFKENPK